MNEEISYEDFLSRYGSLTYTNVGTSMLPLLRQGKDLFTVEKKTEARCKAGDVVLFHRPPDDYVLHRIVQVLPDSYVLLGDNCIDREYGIRDEDILGIMTGFVRGGKQHSISEPGYRFYTTVFLRTASVRIVAKKTVRRMKKMLKRKKQL